MNHCEPRKPRWQAGTFAVRAASLLAPVVLSYLALVLLARVEPREWAVALSWIAVHLSIDHQIRGRG